MKKIATLLALTLLFSSASTPSVSSAGDAAQTPGTDADLRHKMDVLAHDYLSNKGNVGLVVGILDQGRTSVFNYGETAKGSGQQPDENTLFEIGAVTQVFTATILADMAVKGHLNLDDPVEKFLPNTIHVPYYEVAVCTTKEAIDAPNDDNRFYYYYTSCVPDTNNPPKNVSLCKLATHSSGLPSYPQGLHGGQPFKSKKTGLNPFAGYTDKHLYEDLPNHAFEAPPGDRFIESDYGYAILGHVLKLRSGMEYEDILVQELCNKFELNDTRYSLNDDQRKRLAQGHNEKGKPAPNWDFDSFMLSAGVRSTTNNLLAFLNANMQEEGKAIWDETRKSYYHIHKKGLDNTEMALGWMITPLKGNEMDLYWRSAKTGGYYAWVGFIPSTGKGFVVLSNSTNATDDLAMKVLKLTDRANP